MMLRKFSPSNTAKQYPDMQNKNLLEFTLMYAHKYIKYICLEFLK